MRDCRRGLAVLLMTWPDVVAVTIQAVVFVVFGAWAVWYGSKRRGP